MKDQRIAVIGASGQVAQALARAGLARSMPLFVSGRPDVDINDLDSLSRLFADHRPDLIINASAYTAVDKAESDAEAAESANEQGPARLAVLCQATGAALIHISTDYVFDGHKRTPYFEDDARNPQSVYGVTKSAGEDAIRTALPRHAIFRTAWVYGPDGQNFLKTMLRLGAERDEVGVVADQFGTPTPADVVAGTILDIAPRLLNDGDKDSLWGTYHLTAQGETSWQGFAEEIFAQAALAGRKVPRLHAITTEDYPTAAKRPQYSVLDTSKLRKTFGVDLPDWRPGVANCVKRLAH